MSTQTSTRWSAVVAVGVAIVLAALDMTIVAPYLFAEVLRRPPSSAGLVLLAFAGAMAVTSPLAGAVADRIGTAAPLLAGGVVTLAGMAGLATLGAEPHPADLAWRLALIGIGHGLFAGPNSAAILAATPPDMVATAGGVTALFRTLGLTLGPAIGAMSWSFTAGGAAGFRAGALALVVAAAGVLGASLATRPWAARVPASSPT